MSSSSETNLPTGYEWISTLSDRGPERVVRARGRVGEVVLRLGPVGEGDESRAELAVLAAVDHPGLARLLDHGSLPGGAGSFVARSWAEGEDLTAWSVGRDPLAIGLVVAHLCVALDHLHRRGFVHKDLKAANVVVAGDGDEARPVLTDFGLARVAPRVGSEGSAEHSVSGTPFHIAPEVLGGRTADARSDLFALGVMMHELFVGRRVSARAFYGRFPREGFFASTGTRPDDLPEWSRDVVAALLERDPERRPASAAEVGRTLAGRLGLAGLFKDRAPELGWSPMAGREAWCAAWENNANEARLRHLVCPPGEATADLLDALALRGTLAGLVVRRLHLARELEDVRTGADLERRVDELCASCVDTWIYADIASGDIASGDLASGDRWQARAVESLARALEQRSKAGETAPAGLIVIGQREPSLTESGFEVAEVPSVPASALVEFLSERLSFAQGSDEEARVLELASIVHASSGGTAAGVRRALERCGEGGWLLAGDERVRLRPGTLPRPADLGAAAALDTARLGESAAGVVATLHVLGGRASLAELAESTDVEAEALPGALDEVVRSGFARVSGGAHGELELNAPWPVVGPLLDEARWTALHARRADLLTGRGAARERVLPHEVRAGHATAADVVAVCRDLRDRGSSELALRLCDAVERQSAETGGEPSPELMGERAFAWCALGQADRALAAIEPFAQVPTEPDAPSAQSKPRATPPEPRVAALLERVRGQVAYLGHEPARALACFEAALELDPEDGGEAFTHKVRLFYELRRDNEIGELVDEQHPPAGMQTRLWHNVLAIAAMSRFRLGEADVAREALERYVAEARAARDPGRQAGLRINLATIARRTGDERGALAHLRAAARHFDGAGNLSGLAQARALLGSTLRQVGELAEAEPLLASALAIRERLGDSVGTTSVRGMLGLLLLDRGHARPAAQELASSATSLREVGRSVDAAFLDAKALEARARIASDRGRVEREQARVEEIERTAEGDPRILLSLCRTRWLSGELEAAGEMAKRAEALGRSLGLAGVGREAAFLLRVLGNRCEEPPAEADDGTAVAQDERLVHLLATAPFDVARAEELAADLELRGRDDRAARILLALSVRGRAARAREFVARAKERLEACAPGSGATEATSLRQVLLGFPDPWPEDLTAFAALGTDERQDEMEMIKLLEFNHRLVSQKDLEGLLGAIVEQALEVSGAQRGFLILERDGELEVDTALDSRRGGIDAPDVEVSGSVLTEALRTMQTLRISNAVDDPLLGAAPSVVALDLRSVMCVPFEIQKGLRGVIYVDHRLREGAFAERAERMLALLADQAALAILQVQRLEEIRRLNRELKRQVVTKESDLITARHALKSVSLPGPTGGLVGDSAPMSEVRHMLERAARARLAVLITGASGTGKELAVRALHDLSDRRQGPFVSENCAALPASLIEAELFGVRRGAYTGADRDREGLFERAHGGTLFLDEIGELPIELQAKLLRVIETSEVRRLGDNEPRKVDFRLVTATNRDLAKEVDEGRFRADLLFRLDGLSIAMPSLSGRTGDIPLLVDHFLRLQAGPDEEPRVISKAVIARLGRREWPGNVRELFNEVERLCVLSEGDVDDPDLVRAPGIALQALDDGRVRTLAELERQAIERALKATGGDKRRAAELLGISRAKIYQRIKEWRVGEPGS